MATVLGKRELYGGAIAVDLPTHLYDVSERRQVDDAQEVFKDEGSNADEDLQMSYIFDITDRVAETDPVKAARFHFEALGEDNDADELTNKQREVWLSRLVVQLPTDLKRKPSPPSTPEPIIADGIQTVSKFNKPRKYKVRILMALYRLTELPHDIVFTLNVPREMRDDENEDSEEQEAIKTMFVSAARSLKIVDFGLFPQADREMAQ